MANLAAVPTTHHEIILPSHLAEHIRRALNAAWVVSKFDTRELADGCAVAPDGAQANSPARILKDSIRALHAQAFSENGETQIHARRCGKQWQLLARIPLTDNEAHYIVAALATQSPRRVTTAQHRLQELAPLIETIATLMLEDLRNQKKQESMNLIYQVSRNVAALQPLDRLIPQVVSTIRDTFHYDAVSLMLISPTSDSFLTKQVAAGEKVIEFLGVEIPITDAPEGGIVGYVAHMGQSLLVPDVRREPRYLKFVEETKCELAVPLKVGDRIIGVLDVESSKVNSLTESDRFVLEALADQVAIAIENARLYSELSTARDQVELKTRQLHHLLTRTISIQEEERKRISAELHDDVTQLLVSSIYEIQAGRAMLPSNSENSEAKLASGQEMINEALNEMHRAIHDLRPLMHGDIGMAYAIRKLVTSFMAAAGIEQTFEIVGEPHKLPPEVEIAAYRITQEALQNIVKHSDATHVRTQICFDAHSVRLVIQDNGKGFVQPNDQEIYARENLGLVNMQGRALTIGGSLEISSTIGAGTKIVLVIPRERMNNTLE